MREDGILEGDIIIVQKQDTASNGDMVIAVLQNDEVTLKRFYREADQIRLQPSNPAVPPIIVNNSDEITIRGIVIGLLRKL